ncbi:U-box domain-containing protein 8 [Capsicum annuum]|uniref:RING-type E3 ubiquitin transferase n=1 Tax=Capsicum annuum TaxID=4072 RepID=A0A2G3A8V0_CAPAN|nr:U-box domain-containing protein 8 [Capsicum annuum]
MASPSQFPDDFRCPISLEIMSDPVILSSGHTFDRSSIQRWLDSGHRTCPITKLPISDPVSLIPNHALRSLISNYTLVSFPKPLSYPEPKSLIQTLIAASSPLDSKLNSLDKLSKLSKRDSAIRRKLTESGAVSAVLNCVDFDDDSGGFQEKALHLLLNLSLDDDNKVGLVAEGVVGKVVATLRRDAILGLISLLWGGNGRERKEAATALYTLSSFPDNRVRAVENRAVPILIQNANSGLGRAVEVLGLLAKCKEGRQEMIKFGGLLEILIKFLKNGSSRAVQYALLTISLLCNYSERMRVLVVREGVFEICVGLLEDDNEKVRRNANSLIQVLQGKRLSL